MDCDSVAGESRADATGAGSEASQSRLVAVGGLLGAVAVMIVSFSALVVGADPMAAAGADVGQIAPSFSLRDTQERRVALDDFAGQPVLLLFASEDVRKMADCGPDLTEFVERSEAVGGQVNVLVICSSDDAASPALGELTAAMGQGALQLSDPSDEVAHRYEVEQRPTAVVVSADGLVAHRGPMTQTLRQLTALLKGKAVSTPLASLDIAR